MTDYKDKTGREAQLAKRAAAMRENLKRRKQQERERDKDGRKDAEKREH